MHGLVPAIPAGGSHETAPYESSACVVTMPSGWTVPEEIQRFTALGAEIAMAGSENSVPAASVSWGGEVKFIDADCSAPELSRKLLSELAWGYAILIQRPGQDLPSLARALMQPVPLRPGADSNAIWYLKAAKPMVLKVGSPEVISLETAFFSKGRAVSPSLFPFVWAHGNFAERAWYLMEAGRPDTAEDLVFSCRGYKKLAPGWNTELEAKLAPLAALYRDTLVERSCCMARYHYTERIPQVLQRSDFRQTATKIGGIADFADGLLCPLRINGKVVPAVPELVRKASQHAHPALPSFSTMIHGDLHLKNMVAAHDTDDLRLLDPRLQWDAEPVDRFGYGDPVYDMATLLHSIGGMATILRAIETGTAGRIIDLEESAGEVRIQLAPEFLELVETAASRFPAMCRGLLPEETMGSSFAFRLFTGAANATIGWLKYEGSIQCRPAWWAVYALAAMFLNAATGKGLRNA